MIVFFRDRGYVPLNPLPDFNSRQGPPSLQVFISQYPDHVIMSRAQAETVIRHAGHKWQHAGTIIQTPVNPHYLPKIYI